MQKTAGYKGMLRDRIPQTTNYALKWQKAKERWIDHAYRSFIRIFCDKKDRDQATRIVLGLTSGYEPFNLEKSIDWDNLTPEEKAYWKRVSSWVDWFATEYANIKQAYETSRENGKDEFTIKVEIINAYLSALLPDENADWGEKIAKYQYVDDLVDFLIKCFNKRI